MPIFIDHSQFLSAHGLANPIVPTLNGAVDGPFPNWHLHCMTNSHEILEVQIAGQAQGACLYQ
jgi:hypothetical protein